MREYIVLCTEHYNPLGIIRTLGENGIHPVVIITKERPRYVYKSKYVKKTFFVNDAEEGIQIVIHNYSNLNEKSFIFTGDDKTVHALDAHYDELKDHFFFTNCGKAGVIGHYMDKSNARALAEECGINCPKTYYVNKGEIPEDITYPIMTKAINSFGQEWKSVVHICNNEQELKRAFTEIEAQQLILQQYIKKNNEVDFEGVSADDGNDIIICCETYQKYQLEDKYSPYFDIKNLDPADKPLVNKIQHFLQNMRYNGIFEAEFMVDDEGEFWFLEINYRNTAWGYATTVAGNPQVMIWIESVLNGNKIPDNIYNTVPNGMTAMAECWDYDVRVKSGKISHKQWMKEYRKVNAKLYKGEKDFRPFMAFMLYKLTHRV